jgi:hypothetical protein
MFSSLQGRLSRIHGHGLEHISEAVYCSTHTYDIRVLGKVGGLYSLYWVIKKMCNNGWSKCRSAASHAEIQA